MFRSINWSLGALAVAGLLLIATQVPTRAEGPEPIGKVVRLDPKLDAIIAPGTEMVRLATGYDWSEGPVWDRANKFLAFSDVPMNTVYKYKEGAGVRVLLKPSGFTGKSSRSNESGSNGLLRDAEGRLVLCQHGDRRVARLNPDGKTFTTLADKFEGKRFNSPNDGVYHSNGDLYFTDPPYGLAKGNDDPAKEIPFSGVYRLAKSGEVTLLTKELTFPNGIAFSPDEKTLYVANSDPARAIWMAYDVKADGTIANGRVFFDTTAWVKSKKGLPDGLKVDRAGNLFATGPGGVLIFSPDGKHLGTLDTGEATANCAFGDDGKTLFITADMHLVQIRVLTGGF